MFVGIDDTDSVRGMCTTYLAAKLCQILDVTETPKLIRLNPNIPYKTRGNGAVTFRTEKKGAKDIVLSYVKKYSMLDDEKTNPGVAFLEDDPPKELRAFYTRVVSEHVTIEDAEKAASAANVEVHKFKNGRGIVGALAALGFHGKSTYEIIAYRSVENFGKPRRIDLQSVIEMDRKMFPEVFDNVDLKGKRLLITPVGKDPILCGIRGLTREAVESAFKSVRAHEPVDMVQVFETNQATDAHLRHKSISQVMPYDCVIVSGIVSSLPRTFPGGHVIFSVSDSTGSIECATYKKSGPLRDVTRQLKVGDEVSVYGGIGKYPRTVNIEKIEIKSIIESGHKTHPKCCGKNMTSSGRNAGYKCKICGNKVSLESHKVSHASRSVVVGVYDSPPGTRRHLSKPVFLYPYL
jgi:tRNA(Ile2)-agmatinylcytidine synthase